MIEGKSIFLRAVERSDLQVLRDWRNLPQLRRNFREVKELSMQDQENWFKKVSDSRNDFMFVIIRKEDETPIGACGLLYINWVLRSADFSIYIGAGQVYIDDKYAVEAAQLLLKYGFYELNLHKIWTELYEFDEKKINLFDTVLGFSRDGHLRDNAFCEGRYYNSFIYSLLISDFSRQQQ